MRWILASSIPLLFIPSAWSDSPATAQPVIRFATKLAGSGQDSVAGVATDAAGNVYIAGTTSSPDFPVVNAAQPKLAGSSFLRIQGGPSSFSLSASIRQPSRLAATFAQPGLVYAADTGGLKKSTDGGDTWSLVNGVSGIVTALAIDPVNPDLVYVSLGDGSLLKTTDGGATWNPIGAGLSVNGSSRLDIGQLAIDPNQPQVLLGGGSRRPLVSIDGRWRDLVSGECLCRTGSVV
jgi:hypothetical protein